MTLFDRMSHGVPEISSLYNLTENAHQAALPQSHKQLLVLDLAVAWKVWYNVLIPPIAINAENGCIKSKIHLPKLFDCNYILWV